jgi:hypothetical protein
MHDGLQTGYGPPAFFLKVPWDLQRRHALRCKHVAI